MALTKEIDYLTEDPVINDQKYMCISFIKPTSINEKNKDTNITVCGVKIRGSYSTYEEAKTRAEFLQKCDSSHNIYIGEVGKWCPFEDEPEKAKDSEYMNKDLNKLMKTYWKQQTEAKEFHEIRKQEMIKKSLDEVNEKKEELEVNKKVKGKKNKEVKLNDMKEIVENEKEELNNEKIEIDKNINNLRKLEEELAEKMKELEKEKENNIK